MSGNSPLQFPTDYPIKVVGRNEPGFRERVDAIMARHVPDLHPHQVAERPSGKGNFISITYSIVAQSREQVVTLVGELTATEGVLMVI
jgi:uncharacterized protein